VVDVCGVQGVNIVASDDSGSDRLSHMPPADASFASIHRLLRLNFPRAPFYNT